VRRGLPTQRASKIKTQGRGLSGSGLAGDEPGAKIIFRRDLGPAWIPAARYPMRRRTGAWRRRPAIWC